MMSRLYIQTKLSVDESLFDLSFLCYLCSRLLEKSRDYRLSKKSYIYPESIKITHANSESGGGFEKS